MDKESKFNFSKYSLVFNDYEIRKSLILSYIFLPEFYYEFSK